MVAKAVTDGDGAAESSKCWCGHQVASLRGQLPTAKVNRVWSPPAGVSRAA